MKTKTIKWADITLKYANGKNAMIGKIKIGTVHWNGIDSNPELRYVALSFLPNVTSGGRLGKFPTEKQAMEEVERVTNSWINEISE